MKRIMILCDLASVRKPLAEELAADGYLVLPVDKPALAKSVISTLKPDLVLLDLRPKDRWDVLEEMKKQDQYLQILVATGWAKDLGRPFSYVDILKSLAFKPIHPSLFGLGVRKGDREWLDVVDITLLKMMATGDYRRLLEKWFGKVRGEVLELTLERELKGKE